MLKDKKYIVQKPIWSVQHGAYFIPGEVVKWDMKGDNVPDFETLVSEGVLVEDDGPMSDKGKGQDAVTVEKLDN